MLNDKLYKIRYPEFISVPGLDLKD
jgi:hypothetical protein